MTGEGIVKRDEYIFELAVNKFKIPILMLLSDGNSEQTPEVISSSIQNLKRK